MRYKMILSYDGTDYHGYQIQPKHITVQEVLEKAFLRLTGKAIKTFAASRTDQGVSALYQVVHFDFEATIKEDRFVEGLNKCLPQSIKVLKIKKVKESFHARHSSKSKVYLYKIYTKEPNVFEQRFGVYMPNLDIDKMQDATKLFIGTHDFSGFAKLDKDDLKPTVRTIYEFTVKKYPTYIMFKIHGDHFLRYMVRTIVGNLIDIGKGKISSSHISDLLTLKSQHKTSKIAPACGLLLYHIYY